MRTSDDALAFFETFVGLMRPRRAAGAADAGQATARGHDERGATPRW
jgi:hypothetical protein